MSGTDAGGRADNQIVALYEDIATAEVARLSLVQGGIPANAIQIVDGSHIETIPAQTANAEPAETVGLPSQVKSMFAPDEDYREFRDALTEGRAVVAVTLIDGVDRQKALDLLQTAGPLHPPRHA